MNQSRNKTVAATAIVLAATLFLASTRQPIASGADSATADALKQVQLEYAQAMLKSAQANLARAREVNARAPDTIPPPAVRSLENDVAAAEARVKAVQGADGGAGDSPYLIAAKTALAFAESSLKEAQILTPACRELLANRKSSVGRPMSIWLAQGYASPSCSTAPRPKNECNGS